MSAPTPTISLDVAVQVLTKRRDWLIQRIETAARSGKVLAHDRVEVMALDAVIDRLSNQKETSS